MGVTSTGGSAPRRPQKGTGRPGPTGRAAGSAGKRPVRPSAGVSRPAAHPRRRPADPHRVKRTRYGYPTVSERLARQARRMGPRRNRVIGSTVQHNGSLGYISRGPFRGGRRQRALRAQAARVLPLALVVLVVVAGVAGIGYAVQGAWNPLAIFQGPAASSDGALVRSAGEHAASVADAGVRAAQAPDAVVLDVGRVTDTGNGRVTFSAVGDNLANENLLELADAAAGEVGDDAYDFTGFYEHIAPAIRSYDIAFVNQETTLGGPDAYGYNGYPSYNTPDSMADAVADAGWRVVSTNTNHAYDTWTSSIEHAQQVWASKSGELLTVGSFTSQEDRERPRVVECNGLRIAFLSYNYGQNGYEQSDLPNDYYAVTYDREAMLEDVQRARRAADAVVVYMHWGTEYEHEPDETQRTRAQELADAGVDLVIGSHAHVIQPMEWFEGADGGQTLVVFGLGDLLSGYHDAPECILSGMFTCTFARTEQDGQEGGRRVAIEDATWHPLIEHWQDGRDAVYLVEDYTEDQARANELLAGVDDPYQWIVATTEGVIGDGFPIAW